MLEEEKIPKGKGHNATGEYYSYNDASLKRRVRESLEGLGLLLSFIPRGKGSTERRIVKGFHVSSSPSSVPFLLFCDPGDKKT